MDDYFSCWQSWFREHGGRFFLFARQQTRCEEDAEDVFQEALIRVWKFDQETLPSLPQVYTAIRRCAIDLARKNLRRTTREQMWVDEEGKHACWFEQQEETKEEVIMIQKILDDLPEKYREVLTLKIWGELTFAEIAAVLEIPLNTAASRYRYALEKLRHKVIPKIV